MNAVDGRLHRVGRDDREAKRRSERLAEVFGEEDGRGIGDCDEQRPARKRAERERMEVARQIAAQTTGDAEIDVVLAQVDERQLVLLGDELCDLLATDETPLDEQLAELVSRDALPTRVVLRAENGLEILLRDEPVAQQQHAECRPGMRCSLHAPELSAHLRPAFTARENPVVRAVVQRVSEASVMVDGKVVARSGRGILVLLGIAAGDEVAGAEKLAGKVGRLRIFENADGRFDRSLLDINGEALVVSQFTLIADSRLRKGTRPDFSKAARPEAAEPLYERFCDALRREGVPVQTGVFGARMQVSLVNDGPVTIVLDM
jgi:D-aminoacyl-tRNA deacylase